jgi:hypothetical protein
MPENPLAVRVAACTVTLNNIDLGWTKGGTTIDLKTETSRTDTDNFSQTTIVEFITRRILTVKINLAEPSATLLAQILNGTSQWSINNGTGGDGALITGVEYGAGVLISGSYTQKMILHPLDRAATDLSDDLVIPNCISGASLSFAYQVASERVFAVEFTAYPDQYGYLLYLGQ